MRTGARSVFLRAFVAVAGLLALTFTGATAISGQQPFMHGQNVAPAFEGWERNPDGSFNMVFGFFNRNCEEALHIPIGPDNNIEPGGPDRGQPTRLFPRRGKFIFRVRVPSDFGKNELVWTLTAHGKTEKAYGTLRAEYVLDKRIIMMNENSFGQRFGEGDNQYPILDVAGDAHRAVKVGEPLPLRAQASDDGLPLPRTGRDASKEPPLVAGWLLYRGNDAHVAFDPEQVDPDFRRRETCQNVPPARALPPDGKFTVTATFKEPGTYVLRALVRDRALKTTRDVTVTVTM
jgi:hypothetical protein